MQAQFARASSRANCIATAGMLTAYGNAPTIDFMLFDLTEALINQILFSMEDQEGEHVLDLRHGIVVDPETGEAFDDDTDGKEEEGERFMAIPEWSSADGFRLMERFAAGLRNPIVREELTAALDRGRGVFRAFKDVLSNRPEVERLWFSFKEKEMRRVILEWYNALREEWGLERIGEEPEETSDLVLEDFRFREGKAEDEAVERNLHELCLSEAYAGDGAERIEVLLAAIAPALRNPWDFPVVGEVVVETARGDFAGFALVVRDGTVLKLGALDVRAEYRGLGVGEELLARLLESLDRSDAQSLTIDLPIASEPFSRVLIREGFRVFETRYRVDLVRRRRSLP